MTWKKKRVLIVVKAYPEISRKYGSTVCTAGITEDGDWIRLYPITLSKFIGDSGISRYDWIEVECKKRTDEKLNRKESYKVREESIKIIDTSFRTDSDKWKKRNKLILKNLDPSIEFLQEKYSQDKTSLGLIKPKELNEFYKTKDLEKYESNLGFQEKLSGEKIPIPIKIPHIFKYKFICYGCKENHHDIQCEDWELLESYRKWGLRLLIISFLVNNWIILSTKNS